MRNRNSTETFLAPARESALEGMECGSLDRIQHSKPDLEVMMVAWVTSPWGPARRFWAGFQVCDPAELGTGLFRTPRSTRHFRQCLDDSQTTRPSEVWHLQEKLKIAATVVVLELLCRPIDLASQDRQDLRRQLIELLKSPPEAFEPSWAIAARPAQSPEGLIAHCRGGWKTALKRDWEEIYGPVTEPSVAADALI